MCQIRSKIFKLVCDIYCSMVRIFLLLQIVKLALPGLPPCHQLEGRDASISPIFAARVTTNGERAGSAAKIVAADFVFEATVLGEAGVGWITAISVQFWGKVGETFVSWNC